MNFKKIFYSLFILTSICLTSSCTNGQILTNEVDGETLSNIYNIKEIDGKSGGVDLRSTGTQNILVIPVAFNDEEYLSNANDETLSAIEKAFFGSSEETSYESVSSYYYKSSYGKLTLTGKVCDQWFNCGIYTDELKDYELDSSSGEDGTIWLLNQAANWYKSNYDDVDIFDNDNDGLIDAIWLITNVPDYLNDTSLSDTFWAFTFWDTITDKTTYSPCAYSFASYDFMLDSDGSSLSYPDARTYIHETGHLFGLIDYYSDIDQAPMGFVDMMDCNIGDHCAYSKYSLGWITPRLANESGLYTLEPFEENGDCIIVSDSFYNNTPFSEYFIIEFITPTYLNEQDYKNIYTGNNLKGYSKPGIRVTHVDSRGYAIENRIGGTYVTGTYDYDEMDIILTSNFYNSTQSFLFHGETGRPFYRITLIQKNATRNSNVLSDNFFSIIQNLGSRRYSYIDEFLFFENESYSLDDGDYSFLMPSGTTRLNSATYFNFEIIVSEITNDYAKVSIRL